MGSSLISPVRNQFTFMSDQDFQQQVIDRLDRLSTDVQTVRIDVEELRGEAKQAVTDTEKFNEKFSDYRQATQWVVQLAFGLIASATVITIVSTIFKR
jgi:hypothetical protein